MRVGEVLRSATGFDQQIVAIQLPDRRPLFTERCSQRTVLHVGCCDVPFSDADANLRPALARHTDRPDGLDLSEHGIEVLRR